jgi:hypothetical protein
MAHTSGQVMLAEPATDLMTDGRSRRLTPQWCTASLVPKASKPFQNHRTSRSQYRDIKYSTQCASTVNRFQSLGLEELGIRLCDSDFVISGSLKRPSSTTIRLMQARLRHRCSTQGIVVVSLTQCSGISGDFYKLVLRTAAGANSCDVARHSEHLE